MLTLDCYPVGVFLANVDTSLIVATYTSIASAFHQSTEASWLLTAYFLGYIVAPPVVGPLFDAPTRSRIRAQANSPATDKYSMESRATTSAIKSLYSQRT